MNLLRRNLHQVWDQLRAKKAQMPQFLESVQIQNLRGIRELKVKFAYPVTVIAGPNGCGKSTVLFACACAYQVSAKASRENNLTKLLDCGLKAECTLPRPLSRSNRATDRLLL